MKYDQEIGFPIKRKSKVLEKGVSEQREKAEFLREKYKEFKRLKQKGASLREIERTIGTSRRSLSD